MESEGLQDQFELPRFQEAADNLEPASNDHGFSGANDDDWRPRTAPTPPTRIGGTELLLIEHGVPVNELQFAPGTLPQKPHHVPPLGSSDTIGSVD